MAIITLSSDHGTELWMHAPLRAALLAHFKDCLIVDFFHDTVPFRIQHSAYRMRMNLHRFAPGSIHLVLNTMQEFYTWLVIAKIQDQYVLGADTGYFTLAGAYPQDCRLLEFAADPVSALVAGIKNLQTEKDRYFESLPIHTHLLDKKFSAPVPREGQLTGEVLYNDYYGNAVLNIHKKDVESFFGNEKFRIVLSRFDSIDEITGDYNLKADGEMLARFNSAGYLVIAIRNGSAASLLNLHEGKVIRLAYLNDQQNSKIELQA